MSPRPATGELLAGRFRVGEEIGRGGIARVVAAEDTVLGQPVALKILFPQHAEHPVLRERFRREVALARRLVHPGILRVFDLHEDGELLFFAMERLDGEDLAQRLRRTGPLPAGERRRVVTALLDALGAAHGAGVVHRDVKPGNVMLMPGGGVKILDFGLARLETLAGLTARSLVLGTPDYLAPEAINGLPVDARSDLYGLGVVWFEMATGKLPFGAQNVYDLLHAKASGDGPEPAGADVLPAEARLVARLLRRNPDERPASAAETRAAMERRIEAAVPAVPARVCVLCGEPLEAAGACLSCGASTAAPPGDTLVVLVHAEAGVEQVPALMASVGGKPSPGVGLDQGLQRLPAVLLAGVDRAWAHALRLRLVRHGLVVELRSIGESNFDLLHRKSTPGLFLVVGLLATWAVACWLAWLAADTAGLILALAAGPCAGWAFTRRAHWFLQPLFKPETTQGLVSPLHDAWQALLAARPSSATRGLGQTVVRRVHRVVAEAPPPLVGPATALGRAALEALASLAELDREIEASDPRRAWATLEGSRVGAGARAEAVEAIARAEALDGERVRRIQRVLESLTALQEARRALEPEPGLDLDQATAALQRETALLAATTRELEGL